jgi:hypothetical protein
MVAPMGNRWGDSGPPDEAYSRVTRDLAAVTAAFSRHLDELPGRLERTYLCRVRDLDAGEVERLRGVHPQVPWDGSSAYAVAPEGPDRATLLVERSTYDGGAAVLLAFGLVSSVDIPDCFCDACDEDSESAIEQTEDFLGVVVGGCVEFRRERRFDRLPSWAAPIEGTWMEEGYRTAGSMSAHSNPELRGEPFEREWLPWLVRRPR